MKHVLVPRNWLLTLSLFDSFWLLFYGVPSHSGLLFVFSCNTFAFHCSFHIPSHTKSYRQACNKVCSIFMLSVCAMYSIYYILLIHIPVQTLDLIHIKHFFPPRLQCLCFSPEHFTFPLHFLSEASLPEKQTRTVERMRYCRWTQMYCKELFKRVRKYFKD